MADFKSSCHNQDVYEENDDSKSSSFIQTYVGSIHVLHELTIINNLISNTYALNIAEINWQDGLTMNEIIGVIFTNLQWQYVLGTISDEYT